MATLQQYIAERSEGRSSYRLEFRTWNGSAYVWTDYTDRLLDFAEIGSEVENNTFPNAFRMVVGSVTVDNSDGIFSDLDTMDGLLYNSAEPYGKSFAGRMGRILHDSAVDSGVALATFRVEDVSTDGNTATIHTISLDMAAADQAADGETAERHPLGGTDKTSPASWTKTQPAGATDTVALYRVREVEDEDGQHYYSWFRNRRFTDVAERISWALDDLGNDIDKAFTLLTSDGREIVTNRNTPPDDESISTGADANRASAMVWNPARHVLVVCCGHRVYDYDPAANTYTLRNTLTSGRTVVRAFWLPLADSGGKAERIVLVQFDIAAHDAANEKTRTAHVTVLDATGSGAYTLLANEVALGSCFPGYYAVRRGRDISAPDGIYVGLNSDAGTSSGVNITVPFPSTMRCTEASVTAPEYLEVDTILTSGDLTSATGSLPATVQRDKAYIAGVDDAADQGSTGFVDIRFAFHKFCGNFAIVHAASGGRLYYVTWDSTNGYRLAYMGLSTYSTGTAIALPANDYEPHWLHSDISIENDRLYFSTVEWDDSLGQQVATARLHYWDESAAGYTQIDFLNGAGTVSTDYDRYWQVMELQWLELGTDKLCAVLYNRATRKWRFVSDISGVASWANTDAACVAFGASNTKEQDTRIEGLTLNRNYSTARVFFVSGAFLFSYDGATLRWENKTPANASTGRPINTDRGLGVLPCVTEDDYPDSNTPNGILWGVSAADDGPVGAEHPAGEYVLWQFANFDAGFITLLDVSGLSLWDLRVAMAEAFNYVQYYRPDGYFVFRPRQTTGAASFVFSPDRANVMAGARIAGAGYRAILNDIRVKPYSITVQDRTSDIIKGYTEVQSTGELIDVEVGGDPGEDSQWLVRFVTATTYDLYKTQGANASTTTAKATGQSINSVLRSPTDGVYLALHPSYFTGAFTIGDNFSFWALRPMFALQESGSVVSAKDATGIARDRRRHDTFTNRFVDDNRAPDYLANIMAWRGQRRETIVFDTPCDPGLLPLLRATFTSDMLGKSSTTTQIMGVRHGRRRASTVTLAKV